jgi:menaquinone-dependent protoporphyrinogen oxidase
MKVLIAYASRLGSTKAIAERIAVRLGTHGLEARVRPVTSVIDLAPYDAFVIGSAVYAGHWLEEARQFVDDHQAELGTRPVWLFSSGPVGHTATKVAPVRPAEVNELSRVVRAKDHRIFAGALDRAAVDGSDLGFADRFIAKRFVPEGDFRDWPGIDAWADDIARASMAAPVSQG